MQRQTTVSLWCERIIEGCWVLALTLIPIYFNLFSARHFEPDKATTLRSLVLIAAAVGLIRAIEALGARGEPAGPPQAAAGPGLWRRLTAIPLALPAMVYGLVFLISTVGSVVPDVSFWGSYQRLQGTYTNLSYILLFVLLLAGLRTRAQVERVVTITIITGVTVAAYGVLQHQQLDPLPWQGDVISRVASTLGNSIFVAAYMIMVVPLALYRLLAGLSAVRAAAPSASPRADWLWALARGLLLLGGALLLLAVIKFGAAVRTIDFRYWWVFPGAVACATAIWWLLSTDLERGGRAPLWPGLLTLGFLLLLGAQFALSAAANVQASASAQDAPNAADWWLWLLASVGCIGVGYGMALLLPARAAPPSRLSLRIGAAGSGAAALLMIVACVFTQSRGPLLGLGAGLFVFFSLLLWVALRHARAQGAARLAGRLRALLLSWVGLTVLAAAFLVAFNLSQAPVFERLREVPYLGRMGTLLEVDSGTGLVRRLIWGGDDYGGGAIGLITANPLRTVIGWGPESMFVAFNPFFPPSLSNVEARGASPDRSHQAILDELVTRGLIGLASYLFLLISFVTLCIRLLLRSADWRWQIFYVAALSSVVSTFVEGLTGIPIVATLMMFWVTLAITVAGGALDGHYRLSLRSAAAPPAEEPTPAPAAERRRQSGPGNRRGAVARGAAGRGQSGPRSAGRGGPILAYAALLLVALWITWTVNVGPVYADMVFQEGQGLSDRAGLDPNQLVQVIDDYLRTVRSDPGEDFYYLNLGRSLMTMGDSLRLSGVELGQPDPAAAVAPLLRLESPEAVAGFVQRSSPLGMMSYAEAVLLKAHELNPLNKDHFANLGRLNSYWYSLSRDPERLQRALDWYARVAAVAPNDVTLINERAGTVTLLGDYYRAAGNSDQASDQYGQADELLRRSEKLDSRYADTYMRLGDLQQSRGDPPAASTDSYLKAIALAPTVAASAIERIAANLSGSADQILRLRDAFAAAATKSEERAAALAAKPGARPAEIGSANAQAALMQSAVGLLTVRAGDVAGAIGPYQRAVALQPTSVQYSRNYTIVLSDTRRYDDAVGEASRMRALLQAAQRSDEAAQVDQLIQIVQQAQQQN